MDDYQIIEEMSGADGNLAKSVHLCNSIKDQLTVATDALFGSESTDSFDASCNTCKDFKRESFDRKQRVPSIWGFPGHCMKFEKSVVGWPRGQYCGLTCYTNRRTGLTQAESIAKDRAIHALEPQI